MRSKRPRKASPYGHKRTTWANRPPVPHFGRDETWFLRCAKIFAVRSIEDLYFLLAIIFLSSHILILIRFAMVLGKLNRCAHTINQPINLLKKINLSWSRTMPGPKMKMAIDKYERNRRLYNNFYISFAYAISDTDDWHGWMELRYESNTTWPLR